MPARGRTRGELNYWPGYVDALTVLLISIVFVLSIFMLGQFFLAQEITNRDTALDRLNRQILELTDLLALERSGRRTLEDSVSGLQVTLRGAEAERGRLQSLAAEGAGREEAQGAAEEAVAAERRATSRALNQVDILTQQIAALRRQLAGLEEALQATESRDRESQARLADLGSRLNLALAQRVQELARYRSDFFGRLRQVLGARPDVRIVGDRFVFQSELFFERGQAVLRPEAAPELDRVAALVVDLERQIPPDLPWVLRVDGHTDNRAIATAQFPSNWSLSAARAIAVVQYLIGKGVSPQRLLAAGFGEFQPLDLGMTEEAYSRNRRIELKVTER